jgi:two-component system, cell cycle sensor histidine kinase and response regulator CckA
VMPKMRGPALAKQLKELLPNVKIVFMTGYLEQNGDGAEFLKGAFFLQKPFTREGVVTQIGEALKNGKSAKRIVQTTTI